MISRPTQKKEDDTNYKSNENDGLRRFLEQKLTRRRALSTGGKVAIGAAAAAIIAGGGTAAYFASQPAMASTTTATTTATSVSTATTTAVSTTTVISSVSSSLSGTPIVIGSPAPMTGDAAYLGQTTVQAGTMLTEQANANGGVAGRPVQYIFEDGTCAQPEGLLATQKLVEVDHADMLTGGTCSAVVLGTGDYEQKKKIIHILDGASNPLVSQKSGVGGWTNIFSIYPRDDERFKSYVDYLFKTKNLHTYSIISTDDPYARGVATYVTNEVNALGGKILSSDYYTEGTTDFTSDITKIKGIGPDCFLVNVTGSVTDGVAIVKQARDLGLDKVVPSNQWASGCCIVDDQGLKLAGDALEGMTEQEPFVYAPELAPGTKTFQDEYLARWPGTGISGDTVVEYYAIKIALDAMNKAGGPEADKVRPILQSSDYTFDYLGIKIPGFDYQNHAHLPLFLKQVQNGKIVAIAMTPPTPTIHLDEYSSSSTTTSSS